MKQIIDYVQSFVVVALVLAGISGISYQLFKEEGWVETVFGNIWELHVQYPLIAIPVTIAAIFLGVMWRDQQLSHGHVSKVPDAFIYALMAIGVYFVGYYAIYGSL